MPSIAYVVGRALSCKGILGEYYIKADVTQYCFKRTHVFYMLSIILPTITIFLGISLWGLIYLKRRSSEYFRLHSVSELTRFGMIYKEYKDRYCYFDILKMYMRIALTIIINLLDKSSSMMVALMSIILMVYYLSSTKLYPYIYYLS
jgi:hypothetical protein